MAIETLTSLTRNSGQRISWASTMTAVATSRMRLASETAQFRGIGGTTLLSSGFDPTVSTSAGPDIGTVTVEIPVDDKIGFIVSWGATAALDADNAAAATLRVSAGTARRAYRRELGHFDLRLAQTSGGLSQATTGAMWNRFLLGPFESAQFAHESESTVQAPVGRNYVQFRYTGASATSSGPDQPQARRANIFAFKFPTVGYDT